jgi:hypothetical protein
MKRLAGAILTTGLLAGLSAGSASANYPVLECIPNAVGAPDAYVTEALSPKIYASNECIGGRWNGSAGLALESNGQSSNTSYRAFNFGPRPGLRFASACMNVHQVANYGYGGLYTGLGGTAGFASEWVGCNSAAQRDTPYFQISLRCFSSPCQSPGGAGGYDTNRAFVFATFFSADVIDEAVPSLTATGQLFDGDVARGRQDISLSSSDVGSGVHHISITVNGTESKHIGDLCAPGYNTSFTSLQPCPANWAGQATVDTQQDRGWTNGPNDVQICAYDVGGNHSNCVRKTVEVDNSCPGSGGTAASKLDAGADVSGQLRSRASVNSNQSPILRGSLRDSAGDPVPGATVCVYETVDLPDASRELATTLTTQPNGRFATRLEPGPSRTVDLAYRYNTKVLGDQVQLDSTVVPTLTVPRKHLTNGHAALFVGQLPGPNADGRVVALQARAGRKWRTFKQLRTDSDGRFRGKYRFTQTTGLQRYAFRVLVKRQSGYPYEPGGSRKRKLTVRG